jgi:acyl carrier protein
MTLDIIDNKTLELNVINSLQKWADDNRLKKKINLDTNLADEFFIDSLEIVNITMYLEEDLNTKIPDEDIQKFTHSGIGEYFGFPGKTHNLSVKEIVDYLSNADNKHYKI